MAGESVETCLTFLFRDIKHRNLKKPTEPKFNIEQYVESQREKPGCCSWQWQEIKGTRQESTEGYKIKKCKWH